ncbi:MAG: hypothetical protein RL071_1636 [Pseudomonadota bacterium]
MPAPPASTPPELPLNLPVLPLRDLLVFPHMAAPLVIGRPRTRAALQAAWAGDRRVLLVTQRSAAVAEPTLGDVYPVGVVARVLSLLTLPDESLKVHVEGLFRARIVEWWDRVERVDARCAPAMDRVVAPDVDLSAMAAELKEVFAAYARLHRGVAPEMVLAVEAIDQPSRLVDALAGHAPLHQEERVALLEDTDPASRIQRVLRFLRGEIDVLQVERKIKSRVRKQLERGAEEPPPAEAGPTGGGGERDEFRAELAELEARVAAKALSPQAQERVERELRKLRVMSPMSAEATVIRTWIDAVLALPWQAWSTAPLDLSWARRCLDEDHHGLRKVKDRVLEHIAVSQRVGRPPGAVLCLVGPPGVGKTSLARSIARAMRRPFVRQALGGVRDEAEIRGHRRTYIGALPGKLMAGLRRSGTSDPVFLLDEIDKMSTDFRGDPSAALLEVLDPEQNQAFCDHYLDLDYDLSKVMFICTANELSGIPAPLQDRLEVLHLGGYTEAEKRFIARRYLIPRQREQNGVSAEQVLVAPSAVDRLIQDYTREAGVRGLDRHVATLLRKAARRLGEPGAPARLRIDGARVERLLGAPRAPRAAVDGQARVGLVHGLAVTPWGGELLDIEVAALPGKGRLILTGRLGDWLKESAEAALSYLRARAGALGLPAHFHEQVDLHVHYPGNGLKTDGPSAGVAMCTAMVSALLGVPTRPDLAMTGEISLRGEIFPIGGLRDKLMAARRAGCTAAAFPRRNAPEQRELPAALRAGLELHAVGHMDELLPLALRWPGGVAPALGEAQPPSWRVVDPQKSPATEP